jgi:hypothetical protein
MRLEGSASEVVQVRVWIDAELTGDLSSEQEIELVRDDETTWSGVFSAEGEAFMYRIGICAAPGTPWSLTVHKCREGDELLCDGDMLTMAKEWLIGSCDPVM